MGRVKTTLIVYSMHPTQNQLLGRLLRVRTVQRGGLNATEDSPAVDVNSKISSALCVFLVDNARVKQDMRGIQAYLLPHLGP
jgi:hypothetical protein